METNNRRDDLSLNNDSVLLFEISPNESLQFRIPAAANYDEFDFWLLKAIYSPTVVFDMFGCHRNRRYYDHHHRDSKAGGIHKLFVLTSMIHSSPQATKTQKKKKIIS